MRPSKTTLLLRAGLLAFLAGCFNSSSYIPILTGVIGAPNALNQVTTGMVDITVEGNFFTSDTVISWAGKPQVTHYQSPTAASVTLEAGLTNIAGTALVTATSDGDHFSQPVPVTIVNADLTLIGISPLQAPLGAEAVTLKVTGTGFKPDTQILWNLTPLAVTFVSSTALTGQVPAAFLSVPGDQFLQVVRPPCLSGSIVCGDPPPLIMVFSVGPETGTRSVVQGNATDLVWDATHSLFYAALTVPPPPDVITVSTGIIAPIDPVSGSVGTGISTSIADSVQLALSDGDQFLYSWSFATDPVRASLPGLTELIVLVNEDDSQAVAPAPGAPATFAFGGFQTGIVDGVTLRPKLITSFGPGDLRTIAWGADSTTFYALSSFVQGLLAFNVDQSGVTNSTVLTSAVFSPNSQLIFDQTTHRLYGSAGENFDDQGGDPRPFVLNPNNDPLSPTSCPATVDGVLGKVFFACRENGSMTVRSFNLQTQKLISQIVFTAANAFPASPSKVVRWKDNGLAVATNAGIYLYSGAFVR
jgi:hypothetical protein